MVVKKQRKSKEMRATVRASLSVCPFSWEHLPLNERYLAFYEGWSRLLRTMQILSRFQFPFPNQIPPHLQKDRRFQALLRQAHRRANMESLMLSDLVKILSPIKTTIDTPEAVETELA